MASPPSVPASPSQGLTLTDAMSSLPLKTGAVVSAPTINLLTNGATTQLIRANVSFSLRWLVSCLCFLLGKKMCV